MQSSWIYSVIITCIVLAIGSIWLEVRRPGKHWLIGRVIAVIIACAALACIVLPVSYQREINKNNQHKIVLLTAGYNADSIPANSKLFTFDSAIKKENPKAQLITIGELNKADQLHIYGYGLNDYDLQQLSGRPVMFHPGKTPQGITYLSYNSTLKTGETFTVQGSYHNEKAGAVKLVLKGLNSGLDSITVPSKATSDFTLATAPKTNGRVIYQLLADGELQGSLPVQIVPAKPLRVLMLSASPDFETKFLKNWLSENGYAVAARSAISKNKFNTEFINITPFDMNRLSAATLNKFDVVISELSLLNSLNGAESAALKQAVTDGGLGVIVKADSTGKSGWLQKSFPVDRPSGKEPAPGILLVNGEKSLAKFNSGLAHIIVQNGTQPIVTNARNGVLANSTLMGPGKIVFTTLTNTFSWMLAGNKQDYTRLWSVLITKASRKSADVVSGVSVSSLPFVNEPVKLSVTSNQFSAVNINGDHTAPVQDLNVPFEWNTLYRPLTVGWQTTRQNNQVSWWYTYPKTDWQAIQAITKVKATTDFAKAYLKSSIVTRQIHDFVRIDVPKIYFYILLLAACTFLWIETKVS